MHLNYISGTAVRTDHWFSFEGRVTFDKIREAPYKKEGIRYHSFIVAYILRLFDPESILDIKDRSGTTYYLNRKSLNSWLKRNDLENFSDSKYPAILISRLSSTIWHRSVSFILFPKDT